MDAKSFWRGFARGVARGYVAAAVVLVLVLLAACGGVGSADEPSENSPPLDCAARPEVCK